MGHKTFIRINAESRQNKKGQMTKWEDMEPPQGEREYWSEDSIRERSLEEQYPQIESESQEEYEARLQLIGEALLGAAKTETHLSNGKKYFVDYETTESAGKGGERTVYHGHRFEEFEPDVEDLTKQYEAIFGETASEKRIRMLRMALTESDYARTDPSFPRSIEVPRNYDNQKKLARYYVGALDYTERAFVEKGLFEDFGKDRYSQEDEAYVQRVMSDISRQERANNRVALATEAKMFEGLFYPFVMQGFFDESEGARRAGIIVPSEFDDLKKKVDAAIVMPVSYVDEKGERRIVWKPISFDLTTGTGDNKVGRIVRHFDVRHGYADIKYPSTCTGKAIDELKNIPHFAICIERGEFGWFRDRVAGGGPIPEDLKYMINYQIQQQAILAHDYWVNQPNGERKAREMRKIAEHFGARVEKNSKRMRVPAKVVRDKYQSSLRYLDMLH